MTSSDDGRPIETDARLIERARRGEGDAFDALMRRHMRAAYAVALAQTGDRDDAEDVVQDAFVTALERLEEVRRPEAFVGWLLQIVRNRAHNLRRHQRVRTALPLDAAGEAPTRARGPAADAEDAELRGRLLEALAHLTPTQREVVLLYDVQGWTHREIADAVGTSEGAARVHLHHARRALRALLGPTYREETPS
jgi:RNA polymerase sigma-70 factor (ECF subfamily)